MKRGFLNTEKARQRVAEAYVDSESAGPPRKKFKDNDRNRERLDSGGRAEYADRSTIGLHQRPKSLRALLKEMSSPGYVKNRVFSNEIPVADIGELIRCYDMRVAFGVFNQFSSRKEIREQKKTGWSFYSYSDLEKIKDGANSPSVDDQSDNTTNDQEEEALSVAADTDSEEDATASAQLSEAMQVGEMGEASQEQGADQPTGESATSSLTNDSPFNPAYYPSPYPFIPCTHETPTLQQRIPLHLLPQKLHVHDPWKSLSIDEGDSDHETPWLSKITNGRDIIRTYSLSLTLENMEAALEVQQPAKVAEDKAAKVVNMIHMLPAEEPLIEVILPPRPQKRIQVEEAHLYLSPRAVGTGNHSVVYDAEWELPRDLFVEPLMCQTCVVQDVREQLQKSKDQRGCSITKYVRSASPEETPKTGPNVSSGTQTPGPKSMASHISMERHQLREGQVLFTNTGNLSEAAPALASLDSPVLLSSKITDVKMDTQGLGPGAKVEQEGALTVEMMVHDTRDKEAGAQGSAPRKEGMKCEEKLVQVDEDRENVDKDQSEEDIFAIQPPRAARIEAYSGIGVCINTTVKWQYPSGMPCEHRPRPSKPVPRTARLSVVAKLSIQHDRHLAREAKNYQSFPDHFFQHWDGCDVIPPLHDPVSIGALCPQFYGYYTPDDPTDGTKHPNYLSLILLLEHCGREIDPDELDLDEKEECASLVFRFHHAGWLHESFAARNIMWQQGKPTEWPIQRPFSTKSFRLIDFGRSKKFDHLKDRASEEEEALQLFNLLHLRSHPRSEIFKNWSTIL